MSDRRDAADDAATSGGTADEVATEGGSPSAGNVDAPSDSDTIDGVLSPGSTATDAPTDPAD